MVRTGTRSLISDSSTPREISSHQKTFIATEIETANGVLLLAMRNLAATMSAVVARLDRLEGAHFDARNPADLGTVGSLAIQTPESLSSERAAENSSLASQFIQWVDGESSKPIPPLSYLSPQTVVDFVDVPRNITKAKTNRHLNPNSQLPPIFCGWYTPGIIEQAEGFLWCVQIFRG